MFYVYLHRRASDNSVFYIGKGCKYRAYETHKSKRSVYWIRVYQKHGRVVEIVKDNLTEKEALALEVALIAQYGIENLCNHSSGGESGGSGRVWSEESRKKLSESKKGKKQPWAGKHLTEDGRQRIIESKKGKPAPWVAGENNHMKKQEYKDAVIKRCKGVPRLDMIGSKNKSARSVICIETGDHFDTMKSAAEWLISIGRTNSISASSNINSVCLGSLKRAYGFTWKYAER